MFTGIVESLGTVEKLQRLDDCLYLAISPATKFDDIAIGDSIAVNGVCLTVTDFSATGFDTTVVPETLRLTNLAQLQVGNPVNLERSLKASSRIGGHYVQGHVDCLGEILDLQPDGDKAWIAKISLSPALAKYVINKGYIGLDGMSITVIEATPAWFTVTLIPHTQDVTIVKHYQPGTKINIEVDMLGKYVEKLLSKPNL